MHRAISIFSVLIQWSVVMATNMTCPDTIPCDCKEELNFASGINEKVIDCENKGLEEVPNFINFMDESFETLRLGNNMISSLGHSALAGLTVRQIDLSDNPKLNSFSNYAFNGVKGLEVLKIENGRLSSVPVAFEKLKDLRELHLKNNKIARLPNKAFSEMTELRHLDLSNNQAQFPRPFTAFSNLQKLEYLNLKGNGLYNPPVEALHDVPGIHTLILSDNYLRQMPLSILQSLKNLKRLELAGNKIVLEDDELFPGLNLEILSVGGCNLKAITPKTLSSIRNIRNLTIRDCQVSSIPRGTLKMLSRLQYLDISGNPVTVSMDIFTGIENQLTTLKLDKMNLTQYPLKLLARFPRLKDISLNHNKMSFLPGGIFKNLPYGGSRIFVENNVIHKVSHHVMDGARKPVSLFLANNHIKSLAFVIKHPCRFYHSYVDLSGNPVHCNCNTYKMVQQKVFDLVGTCHTPHHHHGLELVWKPNRDSQVNHFEQSTNATEECSSKSRQNQRYDCSCRTWIDYDNPPACAVTGQANPMVFAGKAQLAILAAGYLLMQHW